MRLADWLDQQEADGVEVARLEPPPELLYEDAPDETVFFEEINPCGIFCRREHPFATVERYGHWYYGRGQESSAGLHSPEGKWHLFTRNRELALGTAKARLQ